MRRRHATVLAIQVLIVTGVLVAWELLPGDPRTGAVLLDEFFTGRPSKIWQNALAWAESGILWEAAWVTFQEALIGFGIGSMAGLVLGFGLGASRILGSIFTPMVYAADTVPTLALVPMFIFWFGIGTESKIAMVTLIVFFYVFYNSYAGATQVDEELTAVTKMMGASRLQVLLKVTLPSAIAWVALGLQVAVPHAFTGAIVAEIVAGNQGLGHLITQSASQFNSNGLFAGILVAVALSNSTNALVSLWSRHLLRWRGTGATGAAGIG